MVKFYDPGLSTIDENSLVLHRNENLFIEPEWLDEITKKAAIDANIRFYPDTHYCKLRTALAKRHQVDIENIYVGNGADGVLADVLGCLRNDYSQMIIQDIGFPVYAILAERLKYDAKKLNRNDIGKNPDGQLVILDSPNSITGEIFSYDVFDSILRGKNSFLIWDNVYGEFAGDQITKYPENLVVVKSFSKYFGLAGLRLGYCIASQDLIKRLALYKDVYNVNCMVKQMALELLNQEDQFEMYKSQMLKCKKELEKTLEDLGFELTESKGSFVFMTHPDYSAKWLEEKLHEKNILVRRFANPKIENHLRVSIPPEDKLFYFINNLKEILNQQMAVQ